MREGVKRARGSIRRNISPVSRQIQKTSLFFVRFVVSARYRFPEWLERWIPNLSLLPLSCIFSPFSC